MSTFNITLMISGWADVQAQEAGDAQGDGTTFAVQINGEPRLVMNGTELTTTDTRSVKLGRDGARAAVLAMLEDTIKRVQAGSTPDEVAAPTQPEAKA